MLIRVYSPPAVGTTQTRNREIEDIRIERDRLLNQGPIVSGGRRRELQASLGAEQAMRDLAADLRSQYVLVYSRPDTFVPPDTVEVEARRDGVEFDARGTPIVSGE